VFTGLFTGLAAVAALALAAGCEAGGQGSSTGSSTVTGPTTTSGQTGGSEDCAAGTYDVTALTGKESIDVQGQRIVFSGAVSGLTLELDGSKWELAGDDAKTTIDVAGVTELDAAINGTAGGSYTKSGSEYEFVLEDSAGTADLSIGGVSQQLDMSDVAKSIAPSGKATITCTGDGAKLESDSVSLDLERTGGGTSSSDSTETSETSESNSTSPTTT
jgi:hypothetical protein